MQATNTTLRLPNILALSRELSEIDESLRRLGRQRLIDGLQTGLDRDTVRESLKSIGLVAPDDLCALYGWHNGTRIDVGEVLDDFHIFPGFYFSPLQDALKDYRAFREDRRWNQRWLPILANGGGDFYAVDSSNETATPVIGFMIDQDDQPVEYSSISAMIRTWAEAFASGAFYVDARGYLMADDDRYAEIAARNNPDVALWTS